MLSPDLRHLQAAQGWLELGNHLEANEELENITPKYRAHLAVLELRWQIYAKAQIPKSGPDAQGGIQRMFERRPRGIAVL